MKKIVGLFLSVAIAAPMFLSCTGGSHAKIKTQNDTINYAFGAANGGGIRQYVVGDSATAEEIDLFCDGFEMAFGEKAEGSKRLEIEGYRMGTSMAREMNSGFLFGDSSIVVNKELILDVFNKVIKGEEWVMSNEDGLKYFQDLMAESLKTGDNANLKAEQVDSINMIMGLINANGARKYILMSDTTDNDIKVFVKNFKKGLNAKESDKMYGEGMSIGSTISQQLASSPFLFNDSTISINYGAIKRGIIEGVNRDKDAIMTSEEAANYLNDFFTAKKAEDNKDVAAAGEAFLKENATKEGVKVTESGLQYKVIKMGKGKKPAATDKVRVHYHGTLIDGTVFDSSVERGEPAEFPLNGVIKGWTEGLQLMPVGSKFTFYIPYQLAYGEQGAGDMIAPCSALIFDVELLDIIK